MAPFMVSGSVCVREEQELKVKLKVRDTGRFLVLYTTANQRKACEAAGFLATSVENAKLEWTKAKKIVGSSSVRGERVNRTRKILGNWWHMQSSERRLK
jgi:hypothetical protein